MKTIALAFLALAQIVFAGTRSDAAGDAECHAEIVCELGERGYHVLVPDDWDGVSAMPVLLHFHGWKRQGDLIVKHGRIAGATRQSGVLLLAPNGLGRTWNFWRPETPDVQFALDVLADAASRWPIDADRIYVSGYSFGSAMAWRFACQAGDNFAALLAIAGTLPQPGTTCPTAPLEVRHVHGLGDTVADFPFGPGGDATHPVRLWRDINGCDGEPDAVERWSVTEADLFTRYSWRDCASGAPVTLDVHDRGHFIPVGWIQRQLDELLAPDD